VLERPRRPALFGQLEIYVERKWPTALDARFPHLVRELVDPGGQVLGVDDVAEIERVFRAAVVTRDPDRGLIGVHVFAQRTARQRSGFERFELLWSLELPVPEALPIATSAHPERLADAAAYDDTLLRAFCDVSLEPHVREVVDDLAPAGRRSEVRALEDRSAPTQATQAPSSAGQVEGSTGRHRVTWPHRALPSLLR
jgi:hypothetical protein